MVNLKKNDNLLVNIKSTFNTSMKCQISQVSWPGKSNEAMRSDKSNQLNKCIRKIQNWNKIWKIIQISIISEISKVLTPVHEMASRKNKNIFDSISLFCFLSTRFWRTYGGFRIGFSCIKYLLDQEKSDDSTLNWLIVDRYLKKQCIFWQ